MSKDARDALNLLLAALEEHFAVVKKGDFASEDALELAEDRLQDAFFTYDDLLFTQFEAELPFDILDAEDTLDDDDDDDVEDEDDEDDDAEIFDLLHDDDEDFGDADDE